MIRLLLKIIIILFLLPIDVFAQSTSSLDRDITGLWKGSLYNDTTKKTLPYEIAISEEKGKLSGFSYTLFDIDGKKELGVKKIKIKRKDDQLIIEDVELISNDYSAPPPRKVRQLSIVNLIVNDTAMQLTGKWSTNQTREYRPLTGSMQLQRALDYKPLVLFKKLAELKLDQDLSFVQAENKRNADIAVKEKSITQIKSSIPPPSQIADADKPKEITAPVTDKKSEVVVENKPVDTFIKSTEEPILKPTVNKPEETGAPAPMKKTSLVIAANDAPKKENKATEQLVVKISAVHMPANIVSPAINNKTASSLINDSIAIETKPIDELVKKPADKPKTIIAPVTEKKEVVIAVIDNKKINNQSAVDKPETIITPPVTKKPEPVKKENKPAAEIVKKAVINVNPKAITATVVNNKTAPVTSVKEQVKTPTKTAIAIATPPEQKKEIPVIATPIVPVAAANVSERKMNKEQSVFFESDSLVLTLYDNGDVDGDTVSVLMNGQIIFAKQGLSTKANSKTIYIDKGMPDTLSMVMYAENLGSIPPNTGLLIIMDGEKRYEVRFSADLQTNAAILLRRRKMGN